MSQNAKQIKPGISIFFKKNIEELNKLLREKYFTGVGEPVGENGILNLPQGVFATAMGSFEFHCYSSVREGKGRGCYLRPAFPVSCDYDDVVWVKDLEGNILWQNWYYNEDGTEKE